MSSAPVPLQAAAQGLHPLRPVVLTHRLRILDHLDTQRLLSLAVLDDGRHVGLVQPLPLLCHS